VNDSERAKICSATSLHIVHYRSLSLTDARNAQRSRSGNTIKVFNCRVIKYRAIKCPYTEDHMYACWKFVESY